MAPTALCSREGQSSRSHQTPPLRAPIPVPVQPPVRVRAMNDPRDIQLRQTITAILALTPGTPPWQRQVGEFVSLVQQSDKIWRAPGVERDLYSDVLSGVWEYVLKNFHKYDPDRGAVMTWINNRLKWDLKTSQGKHWEDLGRRLSNFPLGHEDAISWLDRLEAQADQGLYLKQACQYWWEHRAAAQAIHVQGRPDINCDALFQDMLGLSCDPETWLDRRDRPTYRAMAEHYQAPLPTIASFWTNKCLPFVHQLFEDFGFDDAAP
jgi:hypothetical protein